MQMAIAVATTAHTYDYRVGATSADVIRLSKT